MRNTQDWKGPVTWTFLISLQCLFELTDVPAKTTPSGCRTRLWRLKNSDYTFLQQANPKNLTWNTGCFNKKLRIICKDASLKFGLVSSTRADLILQHWLMKGIAPLREYFKTIFFTMADDLPHHVRAMKAVASSGVPIFFNLTTLFPGLSFQPPTHVIVSSTVVHSFVFCVCMSIIKRRRSVLVSFIKILKNTYVLLP